MNIRNTSNKIIMLFVLIVILTGALPAGAQATGATMSWKDTGRLTADQTTYNLREDTADVYTLTYTTHTEPIGDDIVLVLSCLEYGSAFKNKIDHSVNSHVAESWLNDEHTVMALKLEPLEGSTSVSIQMETVTIALTQEQCETWMDNGVLPATGLTVKEYRHSGSASTVLIDGTLLNTVTFGSMTPAVYENNVPIENKYWYSVGVSSIQSIADEMLGNRGGSYGTSNHVIFGPQKDPYLQYDLTSVHVSQMPLVEITGIKVYVPGNNPNISLTGVSNISASIKTSGNDLVWNDFTVGYRWNNWVVGERQSDDNGKAYYIINPPANSRVFNNGTTAIFGILKAGMKLVWSVSSDLPYSSTEKTLLQGDDTQVLYRIPSGTATPHERCLSHIGPQFHIWSRSESDTIYNAYESFHAKNKSSRRIAGSYYSEIFTSTTNSYMLFRPSNDTYNETIPTYNGKVIQTYDFPYEIQPRKIWIGDYNTHAPGTGGVNVYIHLRETTDLAEIRYVLADNTFYFFSQDQIDEINTYLKSPGADEHGIWTDLEHWSESNPVKQVVITWNHLKTDLRRTTGANTPRGFSYGGQVIATAIVKFNYWISPTHEDGTRITSDEMVQVLYDLSTDGSSSVTHSGKPQMASSTDGYLWFRLIPMQDVLFFGIEDKNWYYTRGGASLPQLMDGKENQTVLAERIGFLVGTRGQRQDLILNPEISLHIEGGTNLTNMIGKDGNAMTNDERLIFFSGTFTGTRALSNWIISYDLYNRNTHETTTKTFQVPVLTEDTVLTLPHGNDEYFTAFSMKYEGEINTGHPSDNPNSYLSSDTETELVLVRNMMLKNLTENPFNGKPFNTKTDFSSAELNVRGSATWENCICDDEIHEHGQTMVSASGRGFPYVKICFDQWVKLSGDFEPQRKIFDQTIYQGEDTSTSIVLTVQKTTNSGSSSTIAMSPYVLPWGIAEAAYIEITDPSFTIDTRQSSFFGQSFTSNNVKYEYVSVNGKSFLKINFVDNYIRQESYFLDTKEARINTGPSRNNLAGTIAFSFTTDPAVDTGKHYPIGKVYLDFSQLLDMYNAHTDPTTGAVTGAVDGFTKYFFEGANLVEDTLGLSSSAYNGPKLWEYDFSENSETPYRVDVLYAGGLNVNIIPGKNGTLDEDRITEFKTHERDELRAVVRFSSPSTREVYDLNGYVYIPHTDHDVSYLDDDGNLQTAKSDFDMYLRGVPSDIYKSPAVTGAITYDYTSDLEPSAGSDWLPLTQSSTANWSDAEWRAVRGVRIHISKMEKDTRVDIQLDLGCDAKDTIEIKSAFSSGSYDYKDSPTGNSYEPVRLGKIEYRYNNYTVTDPAVSRIWYDTYNENGQQDSDEETAAKGITVQLYDTDGKTLIHFAVSDEKGGFALESWKNDAGQIMKVVLPTTAIPKNDPDDAPAVWKLTRQSAARITESLSDSDFDREMNTLVLPRFGDDGIPNVSAGLVRLPELSADNITMNIGETVDLSAVMEDFLGEEKTGSGAYNLIFYPAADRHIADVTDGEVSLEMPVAGSTHSNIVKVPVKGLREGQTTANIRTQNKLGDVVETKVTITVNMTYSNITVSKIWDDNNNALGIRPSAITLQLHRTPHDYHDHDDSSMDVTLSAPWIYTFKNLPDYCEHGMKYEYSVSEVQDNSLKNYQAVPGGTGNSLTLTNTLQTFSFEGEKIWEENGTGYTRPESITVNLYRSDDPDTIFKSVTIEKDESKTVQPFTFTDLLQYDPDGNEYTYKVREASIPPHYVEIVTQKDITNVYNIHVFDFEKVWEDDNAPANARPESITVDVYRDEAKYETFELKTTENWKWKRDIPSTEIEGHVFALYEHDVPGYDSVALEPKLEDTDGDSKPDALLFRLKNTYVTPKVTVSGTKNWAGIPEGVEPPVINVTLYRWTDAAAEEKAGEKTVYVGENGFLFEDLDRYDNQGNEYSYRLEEAALNGYTVTYSDAVVDEESGDVILDLTNTYNPSPVFVSIPLIKEVHEANDLSAIFSFILEGMDGVSDTVSLDTNGEGVYETSFTSDFLNFDRPGTYSFTVKEEPGDEEGFIYDSDSFTATVTVQDDQGSLTADVEYVKHIADGEVEYAIIPHFYNTWQEPRITLYGEKIWESVPEDHPVPDAVIKLYRGNETEALMEITLTKGETEFAFEEIAKYDPEGNLYSYRVEEDPLTSFRAEYADVIREENGDLRADITNTYIVPNPTRHDPPVRKVIEGLEGESDAVFSFVLTPMSHNFPMPDGHTGGSKDVSITGVGSAEFGIIEFTEAGVYEYRVKEVKGDAPNYSYDESEYLIRYDVTDNEGQLEAVRTFFKDGEEVDEMAWGIFTNIYDKDEPEPDFPHFFRIGGELPKTGLSALHPSALSAQPLSISYRDSGMELQIPSLDVSAAIVTVPYVDGQYPVEWLGSNAGMLDGSAQPGEGFTVLTGHNHLNTTEAGPFALLQQLNRGDRIFVLNARGALKPFTVYENAKIAADNSAALERIAKTFSNSLTLLTCEDERPDGGYASRRVIAARPE